jgi:hypothetical protein
MADPTGLRGKLLRGWRQLAAKLYPELYAEDSDAARRKLYHEWKRYPIFQLGEGTELLALEDRLQSFLEARSAQAEIAAELAAPVPKPPPLAPPKPRRRRHAA